MEFPPPTPRLYDAVIVGGGISGLSAAWKLSKSGVGNLLLLERGKQIGGTCVSGHAAGIDFAWGAHYVESPAPHVGYLHDIYQELGVIVGYDGDWPVLNADYVVPEPEIGLLAGNRWRPSHFPYQIAKSQDVADYEAFRQAMYRWVEWRDDEGRPAFGRPIGWTSPSDDVRRLDSMTMANYLESIGVRSELVTWYADNRCVDEYGCRVDEVSAWAGIQFWAQSRSSFGDFELPGTPAPKLLSWPQGNAFLAEGLSRRLALEQVKVGVTVVNIMFRPDRAILTCLLPDGSFAAYQSRWVIFAAPKHLVRHVIPSITATDRHEFEQVRYVPWLTAAVHVRKLPRGRGYRPAWEVLAHGAWGLGYIDNRHMDPWADDGPTVLTFYAALTGDVVMQRHTLLDEGWDYWARVILHELERMHPGIARLITRLDVHKWGHAMAAMTPGYLWGSTRERMLRPYERVHFAGADVGGTPVFEQAAYRGIEAAEAVMEGLNVPYTSSL